jgi:hypothetical protein
MFYDEALELLITATDSDRLSHKGRRPHSPAMQQYGLFQNALYTNLRPHFGDGRTMLAGEPPTDDLVMQQLGAAVVLCWHRLPFVVQEQILSQAEDMIPHTASIRDQVRKLVLRRAPKR